jgi:hypothetical protein
VLIIIFYLLDSFLSWEARTKASIIHESINKMAYALTNNSLNLCRARLKEVKEVEHHKETLAEDKIVYHEQGHAVRELGPSTSIPNPFTR